MVALLYCDRTMWAVPWVLPWALPWVFPREFPRGCFRGPFLRRCRGCFRGRCRGRFHGYFRGRLLWYIVVYCDTLAPWQRLWLSRLVEVRDTRQWRAEEKQHDASV